MSNFADSQGRQDLLKKLFGSRIVILQDEDIFMKTHRGRSEAAEVNSTLPRRLRMLLILIDGQRSMGDFRRGLTRFRNLDECFDMLRKMGFIETLPVKLDY